MSIAATYATIVARNATVTGIRTSFDYLPASLNAASLPAALVKVGEAAWNQQAVGLPRQERKYHIAVFVKPVNAGIRDEGYQAVLPILHAMGVSYLQYTTLGDTVDHVVEPFADTGVTPMVYAETTYHGFEMTLTVVEKGT